MFDPNFDISLKSEFSLDELASEFESSFEDDIVAWEGWRGETKESYISFHIDKAYSLNLSKFPYVIRIIGKGVLADNVQQEQYVLFAYKIVRFFRERCSLLDVSATFSMAE